MKYYAEGIQKFERQLRLPVSDFSNILKEKTKNGPDSSELNKGGYSNQWAITMVVATIDCEKNEESSKITETYSDLLSFVFSLIRYLQVFVVLM